jgi:excisionase family DNA binding protein
MSEKEDLLTVEDLSALLKISPGGIYTAMCRGSFPIPHIKVGRRVRFTYEDVSSYLKALPRIDGNGYRLS